MHGLTLLLGVGFVGLASSGPSSQHSNLDAATLEALQALGRSPSHYRLSGSLPHPNVKPGTDMLPGIDHFVWIMFENHSWDNIYGTLKRANTDGFSFNQTGHPVPEIVQKYANGSIQNLYEMPNNCAPKTNGPTQNWDSTHKQINNGSMDGFVTAGGEKPISMGYWTAKQLPFFHALAKTFPISDTFFCSCPGQTWCNRMYLLAATSLGLVDTSQIIPGRAPVPAGNPVSGTIFNTLDAHNISWTNYVDNFGSELSTLFLYGDSRDRATGNGKDMTQFFADAAAGTLPQFSFLDENGNTQSMENPQDTIIGETLLFDIVEALGRSPQWNRTLLFINFDEHGGYYDHVYPPRALAPDGFAPVVPAGELEYEGFTRYGLRVPNIVVSPWAKKNHVSHILYDHTSFLALLQYKWNLPSLTRRDSNANNMLDFIDLHALKAGRPNFSDISALHLGGPGNTTERLMCSVTGAGQIPPLGSTINVTTSATTSAAGADGHQACTHLQP